jgi:hypothetical protein
MRDGIVVRDTTHLVIFYFLLCWEKGKNMTFKALTNQLIVAAVLAGLFFIAMVISVVVASQQASLDTTPAGNRGILIWAAIFFALSAVFGLAVTMGASFAAYNVEKVSESAIGKVIDTVAGFIAQQ